MPEPTYNRMASAIRYLLSHRGGTPSLDTMAEQAGMSPFHFQRVFTEWVGISPARFARYLTKEQLKAQLLSELPIEALADHAGISAPSRIHNLFVTLEAVTPGTYRRGGETLTIRHSFHQTLFGEAHIGVTDRGICWLAFVDSSQRETDLATLAAQWPHAELVHDEAATQPVAERLSTAPLRNSTPLRLLAQGTNFQVKVWEALLRVPPGRLTTYSRIAAAIGSPGASRAVGSAVGANTIACLIPCHRVIREEGIIGQYRWNDTRKAALLAWEQENVREK